MSTHKQSFLNKKIGFTLILGFSFFISWSQSIIHGTILDEKNQPLIGVTIQLEETTIGEVSDAEGNFKFSIPKKYKNHLIVISYLGYKTLKKSITFFKANPTISMEPDSKNLQDVVISGKNEASIAKEAAFKPEVIEMKKMTFNATPVVQIIERIAGVKLRQNGGLGSDFRLMVNGVSGKGIPVFVDNIPVKLLGQGYQLNNISSDMIQHMEVYKGIVPVRYGADALGGLISIKTNTQYKKYTNLSYSYGSWNTHNAYVGTQFLLGKNQFIQINGNYQHSDNNYEMDDIDIIVDDFGNTEKRTVNRFHNDYTSLLGKIQYGFKQTKWADDFRISLSANKIDREIQHGITATDPWGQVKNNSYSYNSMLSWTKQFDRLNTSIIGGYSFENNVFVDTASFIYSWDGTKEDKIASKGESGFYTYGRLPDISTENVFFRVLANYEINEKNEINLTTLNNFKSFTGTDVAARANFKGDLYDTPQHLTKSYAGLSWQSKWLNNKITNVISIKNFYTQSKVIFIKSDLQIGGFEDRQETIIGFSNALKYQINQSWSSYINYERSSRLPDVEEIFGNGLFILPNGKLRPEKSHNINTGVSYKKKTEFYIGGFYRLIKDRIFLDAATINQTSYFNLTGARTIGAEVSVTMRPTIKWDIFANISYQKESLTKIDPFGKLKQRYVGSRIPNRPYLFGNLGLSRKFNDLLVKNSKLTITLNNQFMYRYFLGWDSDGKTSQKANIPTQLISDISLIYLFPNKKISLGIECRNLTDQKAFDNYKVQKSGISFYSKIRIFF